MQFDEILCGSVIGVSQIGHFVDMTERRHWPWSSFFEDRLANVRYIFPRVSHRASARSPWEVINDCWFMVGPVGLCPVVPPDSVSVF